MERRIVLCVFLACFLFASSAYADPLEKHTAIRHCIEVPEHWSIPKITCVSVPKHYAIEISSLPPLLVGHWAPTGKRTGVKFLLLHNPKNRGSVGWSIFYGRWNNVLMIARGNTVWSDKDANGLNDGDQCWIEGDDGELTLLTEEEIKAYHESWLKWIPA